MIIFSSTNVLADLVECQMGIGRPLLEVTETDFELTKRISVIGCNNPHYEVSFAKSGNDVIYDQARDSAFKAIQATLLMSHTTKASIYITFDGATKQIQKIDVGN